MYLLLIRRAAELRHPLPGSPEEEELDCLENALDAYETARHRREAA